MVCASGVGSTPGACRAVAPLPRRASTTPRCDSATKQRQYVSLVWLLPFLVIPEGSPVFSRQFCGAPVAVPAASLAAAAVASCRARARGGTAPPSRQPPWFGPARRLPAVHRIPHRGRRAAARQVRRQLLRMRRTPCRHTPYAPTAPRLAGVGGGGGGGCTHRVKVGGGDPPDPERCGSDARYR